MGFSRSVIKKSDKYVAIQADGSVRSRYPRNDYTSKDLNTALCYVKGDVVRAPIRSLSLHRVTSDGNVGEKVGYCRKMTNIRTKATTTVCFAKGKRINPCKTRPRGGRKYYTNPRVKRRRR